MPLAAVRTIAKKRETSERETNDMAISKPDARLAWLHGMELGTTYEDISELALTEWRMA